MVVVEAVALELLVSSPGSTVVVSGSVEVAVASSVVAEADVTGASPPSGAQAELRTQRRPGSNEEQGRMTVSCHIRWRSSTLLWRWWVTRSAWRLSSAVKVAAGRRE